MIGNLNPLQSRLKSLGWNTHRLAQRVSELDPEQRSAQALYSTVRRAVESPGSVKLETLQRVVAGLDGEVVIKWKQIEVESQEVSL